MVHGKPGDRLDVRRYEGVCQGPEMAQTSPPVLHTGLVGELVSLELALDNLASVVHEVHRKLVPPTPSESLSPNGAFLDLPTMRVCMAKDQLRAIENLLHEINREIGE